MPSQTEIRQAITDQIIEALQSGRLPPWRRPWLHHENAGLPTNIVSRKRYSGINPLIMEIASQRHGFKSKWWGTFKQWAGVCGQVMRRPADVQPGQWGTSIVFFKPVTKVQKNKDTGEEDEIRFGLLKTYTVFNLDQVEGDHLDRFRVNDTTPSNSFIDFEPAEHAIAATGADIRFGGDQAFYRRPSQNCAGDFIQMPAKERFSPPKEFYAVTLHELMHWSECRLGWTGSYAEGELRAEIGGCYALADGVEQD